ncbi:MAG: hypothetical protein WEB88_15670 [Gemmatimonadota bacterium]
MVKLGATKRQDRSTAAKYHAVGQALLRTAHDLETLAEAKYGNGLAIVAIHAAIAFTDALSTAYREIRSTDGDHRRGAEVLMHALGHRADPDQIERLRRILDAKTHASYSGNYYTLEQGQRILRETEAFSSWAEDLFRNRPA